MSIGFVEEQHRTSACVQERQQHEYLLKTAAGARHIESWGCWASTVLGQNIGTRRVGRQQFIAKQSFNCFGEITPGILLLMCDNEEVAQYISGLSQP